MCDTYEAVLDDGRVEWTGRQPEAGRHRVLVTVLHPPAPSPGDVSPKEVQRVLDETRGAWGSGKTLDEIDAEIEKMRAEWNRPWDDPDWKPDGG